MSTWDASQTSRWDVKWAVGTHVRSSKVEGSHTTVGSISREMLIKVMGLNKWGKLEKRSPRAKPYSSGEEKPARRGEGAVSWKEGETQENWQPGQCDKKEDEQLCQMSLSEMRMKNWPLVTDDRESWAESLMWSKERTETRKWGQWKQRSKDQYQGKRRNSVVAGGGCGIERRQQKVEMTACWCAGSAGKRVCLQTEPWARADPALRWRGCPLEPGESPAGQLMEQLLWAVGVLFWLILSEIGSKDFSQDEGARGCWRAEKRGAGNLSLGEWEWVDWENVIGLPGNRGPAKDSWACIYRDRPWWLCVFTHSAMWMGQRIRRKLDLTTVEVLQMSKTSEAGLEKLGRDRDEFGASLGGRGRWGYVGLTGLTHWPGCPLGWRIDVRALEGISSKKGEVVVARGPMLEIEAMVFSPSIQLYRNEVLSPCSHWPSTHPERNSG